MTDDATFDQWDDCAPCEFCNELVHHTRVAEIGWQTIETMPSDVWCYVFVPGAGMGFGARKNSDSGRITSLNGGRIISRATHWRKVWAPPSGDLSGPYEFYGLA